MKISAVMDNIGPSQCSFYLIKEFNRLSASYLNSCSVFVNRITPPVIKPIFSCPIISYFMSYDGIAIATTLDEASSILGARNNSKKFLYLWDLEWLYSPKDYNKVYELLNNPQLKIIARSNSHAKLIENFCNRPVCGIVNNWNKDQLIEVVQ